MAQIEVCFGQVSLETRSHWTEVAKSHSGLDGTYQVLFTQLSELVEFLRHEKLGTAHRGSDFP